MKEENNNNNLPVPYNNKFWKKFREKLKRLFLVGISLSGIITPHPQQADTPRDVNADIHNTTSINEVIKEDMNAKYEQAFKDLGVKVTMPQITKLETGARIEAGKPFDKEKLNIEHERPDDGPPEEGYQDPVKRAEYANVGKKNGDDDKDSDFLKKLKLGTYDDPKHNDTNREKHRKEKTNNERA